MRTYKPSITELTNKNLAFQSNPIKSIVCRADVTSQEQVGLGGIDLDHEVMAVLIIHLPQTTAPEELTLTSMVLLEGADSPEK